MEGRLTPNLLPARAGELSPGKASSRTSQDERRKKRRERVYQPNLGLFLAIKLPGLRIVATEAYVALLRTICDRLKFEFRVLLVTKRTDFELIGRT